MDAPWFGILIGVPELAGGIGLLLALWVLPSLGLAGVMIGRPSATCASATR
jgi:hypothetical protein